MIPCPKCSRENADDALYCDQCRTAVSPDVHGEVLAEPCPACGGKVKEVPTTAAACSDCGIWMGETGSLAPSGAVAGRGEAHHAPEAEGGPTEPCPVCEAERPLSAAVCPGCGISFSARRMVKCPRCEAESDQDKCECGAILTLRKLVEYAEPAVKSVCVVCKQLYTVERSECADCGGETRSARTLKEHAAAQR